MKSIRVVVGLLVVTAAVAGAAIWWTGRAAASAEGSGFEATGVLEARQVALAAEVASKVVAVFIEEGQPAEAGQALVRLDGELLDAQRAQAQAMLQVAQANLDGLLAGSGEEEIRAARAQLDQAEASLRLAQSALDTLTKRSRPEVVAAAWAHLERSQAHYRGLTAPLTADQTEAVQDVLATSEANLLRARQRLSRLQADSQNPDFALDALAASVSDAEAAQAAARQAVQVASGQSEPSYLQVGAARLTWEITETNLSQARARLDALRGDDRAPQDVLDAAEAARADARSANDAAREAYDALSEGAAGARLVSAWDEVVEARAHLISLGDASTPALSVEAALEQVEAAEAARQLAEANLAVLLRGARSEQIEAARAEVAAARAQLQALEVQIERLTLTAPWKGVVLTRVAEIGQLALPGAALIELGRLDPLELTVYLNEIDFGRIRIGDPAEIRVDAYPGRTFEATVLRTAQEAEFTPTNIETREDRTRLVYAVVLGLDNPDLSLKPGMIADVEFTSWAGR